MWDKKYFRKIFDEYYQPLYHLSVSYIHDEKESENIVQDAFLKLWENRLKLEVNSNIRNYLFTLVKNSCLNFLKHRKVLLKHHENIKRKENHYHYESLLRVGSDYLEFKEVEKKIDLAIQKLPEQCRLVFELSRFEELKNREIAERLGISQKTVEAHLTKALKILRKELKDYLPVILIFFKLLN